MEYGYFLSFVSLVAVGGALMMPKVIGRLREPGTLALDFARYTIGHVLFANAPGALLLVVGAIFQGAGFGLSAPLVNHMTIEQSHGQVRGRNLAYLSTAICLGQFLSAGVESLSQVTHGFAIRAKAKEPALVG